MSDLRPPSRPRTRTALALAATFGLVLALVQGVVGPAAADPPLPSPTSLTVEAFSPDTVTGQVAGAPGAAIPAVLAAVGDTFQVEVSLWAGDGIAAAYPNAQKVKLSASGPGALSLVEGTIPANQSSAEFSVSYSASAAGVVVTAKVGNGNKALSDTSNAFDINRVLNFFPQTDGFLEAGADGENCTTVDADRPLCGIVTLPNGTASGVALSLGECPSGEDCLRGNLVTQLIADLGGIYDRANPARMELVCDKLVCGKGGVSKYTAIWSQTAFGTLTPVPACSAKGVIDSDLTYCTDYRSSTRDNAADLHLIVLFLDDVRGSI